MTTDGPGILRSLADDIESQRAVLTEAITLLRRITSSAQWERIDQHTECYASLRDAQTLLRQFETKGNRVL